MDDEQWTTSTVRYSTLHSTIDKSILILWVPSCQRICYGYCCFDLENYLCLEDEGDKGYGVEIIALFSSEEWRKIWIFYLNVVIISSSTLIVDLWFVCDFFDWLLIFSFCFCCFLIYKIGFRMAVFITYYLVIWNFLWLFCFVFEELSRMLNMFVWHPSVQKSIA